MTPPEPTPALEVLLDLRHPLACLALRPAMDFARALSIPVDWLPLTVPNLKPPSAPGPGDDRGVRHRRYRAQAIAREIETYADVQGLVLREPYRDGDWSAARLAWLWMRAHRRERLPALLLRLFDDYWSLALDPADGPQVAARVDAVGGDGAAFLAWSEGPGVAVAEALAAGLRERGLFQVPAFVAGDEVFYGRQHLPMIRWMLEGRTGPVPI